VIGECRNVINRAQAELPIHHPVYLATDPLVKAIDELAGAITGDRGYFRLRPPTTPPGRL
jgi:hypothetical protein